MVYADPTCRIDSPTEQAGVASSYGKGEKRCKRERRTRSLKPFQEAAPFRTPQPATDNLKQGQGRICMDVSTRAMGLTVLLP